MQFNVQDVYAIKFSSFVCYDTISYYDITDTSRFINCYDTSAFCMHVVHDTAYDRSEETRLNSSHSGESRMPSSA